jgi:glycerol-3-phosphate O-acyltransferase
VATEAHPATNEGQRSVGDGRRVVYLIDASSRIEGQLLRDWIKQNGPGESSSYDVIGIPPSRGKRRRSVDPMLDARLAEGDDPLLQPLRIAWHPPQRQGARVARLYDLVTFGDPRDPGRLRQRYVLNRHPDRCSVVVGEPAPLSELRQRWRAAGGTDATNTTGLAEFVVRQASLANERAERRLRGTRYKVPHLVEEDIVARPAFRGGIARLARETGRGEDAVLRAAVRYLREIAADHSTYVIDLVAHVIHYLYTRGYSLHYDRAELERVYSISQRHPVIFLPTHKSNLDHLILQYALHENGLPPNHTAGGINMNFFPVGPLMRRSGVFFIRRTFKDNEAYKFVLRQYIDYLIEKRFSLEWYIEGGRSRSGKLLPPRFGLLAYVVDAYRRGKGEDVVLIPVSIAYDQIQDVGDYVAEQRGAAKQRESFRWFVGVVRRMRRRYGRIHINFGEPLPLSEAVGPPQPGAEPNADEKNLELQKIAFEACLRINRATPITPTSLVTLALLGVHDRALTVQETVAALRNLLKYVRRNKLPTTGDLDLDTPEGVSRTLAALTDSGVVTSFAEGPQPVYVIGPDQHLTAAYYRNTIIHFFVNLAIAEIAVLAASETSSPSSPQALKSTEVFWEQAMGLRDLLKFEFFFADKEEFRAEMRRELAGQDPQWEAVLDSGPAATEALVRRVQPYSSHRILRPFVEAYRVVADQLLLEPADARIDEKAFLKRCLALGKQYKMQRKIRTAESVSKVLFETAWKLAGNRRLLDPAEPDVVARRRAFAREIETVIRRIDVIGALAAKRFESLVAADSGRGE